MKLWLGMKEVKRVAHGRNSVGIGYFDCSFIQCFLTTLCYLRPRVGKTMLKLQGELKQEDNVHLQLEANWTE